MLEDKLIFILMVIISSSLEGIVLNVLLSEFTNLKNSKKKLNISLFIYITIIAISELITRNFIFEMNCPITDASLNTIIYRVLKSVIYLILIIIFIKVNYDVNIYKSIIIGISYIFILGAFNEIVYAFLSILCNKLIDMQYGWYYTLMYHEKLVSLEIIILSKLLLIYLVTIIKIIKLKVQFDKKIYKYIYFSIGANLASAILIFTIIYKATQSSTNLFLDIIIIAISSGILILNIFFMWLIIRVIKDNNLKAENKCIKENIQLQYKYYSNMQQSQLKVKKLYHDMKNHMICIENLYGKNEYVTNINNQLEECTSIFNTNNMILDIILNDKKNICQSKGIDLFADINFKECDFIDLADVCSIFSNMIDNAIEACEKIENNNIVKKIKIKGTIVKKLYVIKCENTKTNKVELKNGLAITDKKDKFLHGVGISSMKTSIEKYNGNLEVNDLENKFLVNICIPLRIENFQLCSQNA